MTEGLDGLLPPRTSTTLTQMKPVSVGLKRMGTAGPDLSTRGRDDGAVGPLSPPGPCGLSITRLSSPSPPLRAEKPSLDQLKLISNESLHLHQDVSGRPDWRCQSCREHPDPPTLACPCAPVAGAPTDG